MPTANSQAHVIFKARGGILRTREALKAGIHPRTLYAMRNIGPLAAALECRPEDIMP